MLAIPGWSGREMQSQERREGGETASLGSKMLQGSQGLVLPCQEKRKLRLLPCLFAQLFS